MINILSKKYLFLINRKYLLPLIISDIFLIFFILQDVENLPIKLIFILYWCIFSYILGRYDSSKRKNIFLFSKQISSSIILYIFTIFGSYVFNFDNNIIHAPFISDFTILTSISLLTQYFLTSILSFYRTKNELDLNKWILIKSSYNYSSTNSPFEDKFIRNKLKSIDFKELNGMNLSKYSGILIDNFDDLDKEQLNTIYSIQVKRFIVSSYEAWFEDNFNRCSLNNINREYFMNRNIKLLDSSIGIRIKNIFEYIIALILILITLPVVFIIGLLIYFEDRGPILYSQVRTGLYGKQFRIYKLRSMRVDAEKDGVQWSEKNDNRITIIGQLIRKTRLDELPQLWSVIIGDMSLIGPRPERPEIEFNLIKEIKNYNIRYLVKPGISGWAQVNYPYGASNNDSKMKLSYDLYYVKNYSTFLDMVIFFKTMRLVFNAKGAIAQE